MNATRLNKSELFRKVIAVHLNAMNPTKPRLKVVKEPFFDLSCLNAVDQVVFWCALAFAVWALGLWEWFT
jgi:hypothetical protein